jgi:hypothetical protein
VTQVKSPLGSITNMKPGDHACCIHDTEKEHRNIITMFLRKGPGQEGKVFSGLSVRSIICKDINSAGDWMVNSKQDENISAVKNL